MSDSAAPGWYHAEGDPPNTERYWDGSAWTEGPRPIGGASVEPTPAPEEPHSDMPVMGDTPGSSMPVMGETPDADAPASGVPGSDMPVTGAAAAETEIAGMGNGFPSADPAPDGLGTVTPSPSDLPGAAPGGFSATTPNPSTPPPGAFGGSNMPVTGGAPAGGFATPGAGVPPAAGGPGQFPGAPAGGFGNVYAESSQATVALVLSIVGIFCCGLPSIVGLVLGFNERKAIDEGRRDPSNRGQAVAAMVIGGIITAFVLIIGVLYVIAIAASA